MIERLRKRNKKGSSLMFVIIAVAFVGILSTIILRVTSINIETKSTDRKIKKNFYTTEGVMDKLNIAIENISKDAMKEAYVDLLENYTSDGMNTTDQNMVQNKFAKKYLDNLIGKLSPGNAMAADYTLAAETMYSVDRIKDALKEVLNKTGEANNLDNWIDADYMSKNGYLSLTYDASNYDAEKYLVLKGIKVKYTENPSDPVSEVSTWITTDIKIVVPKLNFESGSVYPDFTKYAIIGNDKVDAKEGCANAEVIGNVYAGPNGLNVAGNGDTLAIGGSSSRLVVRGDIDVQQTGGLTLGSKGNPIEVWAENYRTSILKDSKVAAKLTVYGDSYIHDDLALDGPHSDVQFLEGKYYGYSFNKDNTSDSITTVNSMYSSAITINGKHSSLKMDNMTDILLGGRAFISRNQDSGNATGSNLRTDIPIGESISVKSNQSFYLVSNDDLDSSKGFTNPMPIAKYRNVVDESPMSANAYKTLKSYVKAAEPVTTYIYDLSGTSTDAAMVYFYYNFKSQDAADRYFRNYCDKNEMAKKIVSSKYLTFPSGIDITLSENLTLLTAGNSLTFKDESSGIQSDSATITDENEEYYKKESVTKAAKYKSYQLTLTDSDWSKYAQSGLSSGEDGFDLEVNEDTKKKTDNPVFDTLIAKEEGAKDYLFVEHAKKSGDSYGFKVLQGSIKYKAVPVEVNGQNVYAIFVVETTDGNIIGNGGAVSLNTVLGKVGFNEMNDAGIVVSNCTIKADCNFDGLIISNTTVSVGGAAKKITAQSALLQEMFTVQKAKEGSLDDAERFLRYFVAFSDTIFGQDVETAEDSVDFSSCIKYVNWKKNNE